MGAGQAHIWWGCRNHGKEIGFYSNCHRNSVKDVGQERDMISFGLSPDHPGFNVENGPQTRRKQEDSLSGFYGGPDRRKWRLRLGCWQWRWCQMVKEIQGFVPE